MTLYLSMREFNYYIPPFLSLLLEEWTEPLLKYKCVTSKQQTEVIELPMSIVQAHGILASNPAPLGRKEDPGINCMRMCSFQ